MQFNIWIYLQDWDTSVLIEWMRLLDVAHEFPTYVATLNEALMNIFKYKRFELCKKSCPVTCLSDNFQAAKNEISVQLWGHGSCTISRVWLPKWSAKKLPMNFPLLVASIPWWKRFISSNWIFFSPQAKKNWVKYCIWNHLHQLYIFVVNPLD